MKTFDTLKLFILGLIGFCSCSKKGEVIIEPGYGNYTFSTYTVDSFRFRVIIDGVIVTDSLKSPVSNFSKDIFFTGSDPANLKVLNAVTNESYIDTAIKLNIGKSTISVIQLISGQKPRLAPLPNEPQPSNGKYKIRVQYLPANSNTAFFYDSVKCIFRSGGVDFDSTILDKYEFSKFYELNTTSTNNFTLRVYHPTTGMLIDPSINTIGNSYTGFNTARVYATSSSNFLIGRIY